MTRARADVPVEYLRECLIYYPTSGDFTWRARPRHHFLDEMGWKVFNGKFAGKKAEPSQDEHGYVRFAIRVEGKIVRIRAHRIAWALHHGRWPVLDIDHANLNKADNRIKNLREATVSQNQANRPALKHNKLGIKGVHFNGRGYVALMHRNGKQDYLGYYKTAAAAQAAHRKAALEHHGEFARFEP